MPPVTKKTPKNKQSQKVVTKINIMTPGNVIRKIEKPISIVPERRESIPRQPFELLETLTVTADVEALKTQFPLFVTISFPSFTTSCCFPHSRMEIGSMAVADGVFSIDDGNMIAS